MATTRTDDLIQFGKIDDGIQQIVCPRFLLFHELLEKHSYLDGYFWRGQEQENWKLESSLHRMFNGAQGVVDSCSAHLETFRMGARGRLSESVDRVSDIEMLAHGQHNGLKTPLLDWSRLPYIATFFAFERPDDRIDSPSKHRAVFVLNPDFAQKIEFDFESSDKEPLIGWIEVLSNENGRALNQHALFTWSTWGWDIESCVKQRTKQSQSKHSARPNLVKILIPSSERRNVLRSLDRMGINRLTLQPDLEGAAIHSNMRNFPTITKGSRY